MSKRIADKGKLRSAPCQFVTSSITMRVALLPQACAWWHAMHAKVRTAAGSAGLPAFQKLSRRSFSNNKRRRAIWIAQLVIQSGRQTHGERDGRLSRTVDDQDQRHRHGRLRIRAEGR